MKHLVKKYVKFIQGSKKTSDIVNNAPVDEDKIKEIADSGLENYYAWVITDKHEFYQTFKYNHEGKIFLLPEPDPIVIYFDAAIFYHKCLNQEREKLFSDLVSSYENVYAINKNFYDYFSKACSYVIFLFISIETMINKIIPNDYEYKKNISNKKTEIYNKYQVQRNIEFIEKIKSILPEATGRNFVSEFTHKFEQIKKLKKFRDEIIHTKSFEDKMNPNFYQDLYVMSLDFDYDNTLEFSRDFINYYQDNLIEECTCGED